jgi:NitT/TauT family transport system permease protein
VAGHRSRGGAGAWHAVSRNDQTAFFLGEPVKVAGRIWSWFVPVGFAPNALFAEGLPGRADIYPHLGVTLLETVLAFGIGTVLGLVVGLWLALAPTASAILDPYIKALNSMPRVILAPIFALWFGLGIWSKVALAVTLVFFIVVLQRLPGRARSEPGGARQCAHAGRQPEAVAAHRVPCQRHQLGLLQPAHVGRPRLRGRGGGEYLGSARGVGYLILQAEGTFDVNTVFARHRGAHRVCAGAGLAGGTHRTAPDEMAAAAGRNGKAVAP